MIEASIKKPVTMESVAKAAGVSRSTVSYVLAGKAKIKQISPATERKVHSVAKKVNYIPNRLAKSLVNQRTGVVSLLIGELSHDWAGRIVHGATEGCLDAEEYTLFIGVHMRNAKKEKRELFSAIERRDEGVICHPMPQCVENYKELVQIGIPFVFVGNFLEDVPEASYVAWDVAPAVRVAMEHLISKGYRKIGYIGSTLPAWSSRVRYSTYREVLEKAGLPINEDWIGRETPTLPPDRVLEPMFSPDCDRPDALFVENDPLALQVLDDLNRMGIKVPDDVALIGLGDASESSHSRINLTTVVEPVKELGQQAAKILLELIREPQKGPIHRLIKGVELKIRGTA